jgi:hypothetical protein
VQCIQITVTPSAAPATSQTFTVTAGTSTAAGVPLGTLPIGTDTISGKAYTVACASIASAQPAWTAATQTVYVQPGVVGAVTLTFLQDNAVTATSNFVGNLTQVSIGNSSDFIMAFFSNGSIELLGGDNASLLGSYASFTPVSFAGVSGVNNMASTVNNDCVTTTGGQLWCNGSYPGNGTSWSSTSAFTETFTGGVTQVAAGGNFDCALVNGGVSCWGGGAVGNGTTLALSPVVALGGTAAVTSLSAGNTHACAVQAGQVYCWGTNPQGQLGAGNTTNYYSPNPVPGLVQQVQVVAGNQHTCSLRGDGNVSCWGYNASGQIGNGGTTNALSPVSVQGFVSQLAASGNATCALGTPGNPNTQGVVWCWGAGTECGNPNGQPTVLTPQRVLNLPPSVALFSFGMSGTFCSLGTDQSLECWGGIPSGASQKPAFVPTAMTL